MAIPTKQDIEKISLHEPVVNACLKWHDLGDMTYEEALMMMVVSLYEQKTVLSSQLKTTMERSAIPPTIILDKSNKIIEHSDSPRQGIASGSSKEKDLR